MRIAPDDWEEQELRKSFLKDVPPEGPARRRFVIEQTTFTYLTLLTREALIDFMEYVMFVTHQPLSCLPPDSTSEARHLFMMQQLLLEQFEVMTDEQFEDVEHRMLNEMRVCRGM